MSATVCKVQGRPKARGYSAVANCLRVSFSGWGGDRDQFGVHEVVHVLTVLTLLSRQALLDGPCGREVGDAAIPGQRE